MAIEWRGKNIKVNISKLFQKPMTWTSIGLLFLFMNLLGIGGNNQTWDVISRIAYVLGIAGTLIYFFVIISQQKY